MQPRQTRVKGYCMPAMIWNTVSIPIRGEGDGMIELFWKNAAAQVIGSDDGASPDDLEKISDSVRRGQESIQQRVRDGGCGFAALPGQADDSSQVKRMAEKFRPATTDLVVLSLDGSAQGCLAIHHALHPAAYNLLSDRKRGGPRLFILDSADPATLADTVHVLGRRIRTTLVNVISSGGETPGTAAQLLVLRELLRKKLGVSYAEHVVVTAGAADAAMCELAASEGYTSLSAPTNARESFAALSPAGLFPAVLCGIDIDALLAGAVEMKKRTEIADWRENPACMLAAVHFIAATRKGKNLCVMAPCSSRLLAMAQWLCRLWKESLERKTDRDGREIPSATTPLVSTAGVNPAGEIPLFLDGQNNKFIVFVEAIKPPCEVRVPDVSGDMAGLAYLRKARLGNLLGAEKRAAEYALIAARRPNITLRLNSITPQSVGEFMYLYEYTAAVLGELYNIDILNRPSDESLKKAAFALQGRPGYEDLAKGVKAQTNLDRKYLL
jgi:glucose-6-phosphate isomerase